MIMNWFNKIKKKNVEILATNDGMIKSLLLLKDGVFSKKMLGDGIAIFLNTDKKLVDILSPIDGKLVTVFPTNHAFGIKTNDELEILVHIGIDTVHLKGKGFNSHVFQNQYVKKGDKLATINVEYIRKYVPIIDVIIVVTSKQKIDEVTSGKIKKGEKIFKII